MHTGRRQGARILAASCLVLALALAGCGGPESDDADRDGMVDGQEQLGWTVTVDLLGHRVARHVDSDPHDNDTDDDGLPDAIEAQYPGGLDPRSPDTDEDGLTDCQETLHKDAATCGKPGVAFDGGYGTTANNADSELGGRYYAGNYRDDTGTLKALTWGDGLADGVEVAGYKVTTPDGIERTVRTDPREADSDGDGLHDGEEAYRFAADPTLADTDQDGCRDGADPFPGQAERYVPGVAALSLPYAGRVTLHYNLAGRQADVGPVDWPAEGGNVSLLAAPAALASACTASALQPWMLVQVLIGLDGEGVAMNATGAYWNARTGAFAAGFGGPADPSAALLTGPGASLRLGPAVRLPHGAWPAAA